MSMPKIECCHVDICCAAASLLQSIALEEAAISHIINAEGEKIQKAIDLCETDVDDLIKVNNSVESLIEKLTSLEMVLKSKIDAIKPIIEECHFPKPPKCDCD